MRGTRAAAKATDVFSMDPQRYAQAGGSLAMRIGGHLRWPVSRFLARQHAAG